jgi:hypothetical protein
VSRAGIPWVYTDGSSGTAELTYGHNGCGEIDASGFCSTGVWLSVPGAHWIYKTQNVTEDEANLGTEVITFTDSFELPSSASVITATLQITADNAFRVWLNGEFIGTHGTMFAYPWGAGDGTEGTLWPYAVTPTPGANVLLIEMLNHGTMTGEVPEPPLTPWESPSGLIYRLDISFQS